MEPAIWRVPPVNEWNTISSVFIPHRADAKPFDLTYVSFQAYLRSELMMSSVLLRVEGPEAREKPVNEFDSSHLQRLLSDSVRALQLQSD